ncbi:MAG: hypothetical protein WEB06_06005 [Actinomycetota bacterium]
MTMFSTPGNVPDNHPAAWSDTVAGFLENVAAAGDFPQFYNPTVVDTPDDAVVARVVWPAFPASLAGPPSQRLAIADKDRSTQDEYCEWAVEKNEAEKITRVTFTTEVPEYFDHLFRSDPDALLTLYRELVGPQVEPGDLTQDGFYLRENIWNQLLDSTRPVHLIQDSNKLIAALVLAAEATILRERDGVPVTHPQALVDCAGLGNPLRGSDPQIAAAVNNAAATGAEITLNDPVGLYIDGLITGGMETPDEVDPATFWTVDRGDADRAVRASFEVPEGRGYVVGEVKIDGQPIAFGGQLAVRVRVRIEALVKPGQHQPDRQPCSN